MAWVFLLFGKNDTFWKEPDAAKIAVAKRLNYREADLLSDSWRYGYD